MSFLPFDEPVTMMTDYLITLACGYFIVRLIRMPHQGIRARYWWTASFVFMALASALGGTYHGWRPFISDSVYETLWFLTVAAISLASSFAVLGSIRATLSSRWFGYACILVCVKTLVSIAFSQDNYLYTIIDYGSAMLIVLTLHCAHRTNPGSRWMMCGVVVAFIAAGVQLSGIRLHQHFNHNDLYHLIQILAIWAFFRGTTLLEDHP